MAKKLKLGGLDIDLPDFDSIEDAYSWANSADGAAILEEVFADALANGTTNFNFEF